MSEVVFGLVLGSLIGLGSTEVGIWLGKRKARRASDHTEGNDER